jgi:hypothetical protein
VFKELISEQLEIKKFNCLVAKWINTLDTEDKDAFVQLKEALTKDSKHINVASLFQSLSQKASVPFRLTAFRSHMQGYCTCQN